MSTVLTLELPDELACRARELAAASNRRVEDVIVEWIGRAVGQAVESLPDAELLALCDSRLDPVRQEQLSDLLARLREGELPAADQAKLDELMSLYRVGMVRKARAVREAVVRGLRPRQDF